ncbi:MAG TPA: hypothetical protein VGW38_12495 [Chloroflexota bacterium]|nr:hypothetical protein [Chloroflexota bacterium]
MPKRRITKTNTKTTAAAPKDAPAGLTLSPAERVDLLRRANRGEQQALEQLRVLFDATPGLWEANGDLAHHVEQAWIKTIAGENTFFITSVEHTLQAMRTELAGPAPSPLERLLVERIIACWLHLHYVDTAYAQRLSKGVEWSVTRHYQAWLDRAQHRYLAALKTLAQVRRLLVPVVQVNIADKQVNVAGPAAVET